MRRTIFLVFLGTVVFCVAFFGMGLFSPVAPAVPAFARKTGLACSSCHEVWPRLNDFGQLFRDRGYRLERDRDAPVEQDGSFWPIAMRTTVGYQWVRQTQVPTDTGPIDTQTGTFGFTGLDVFAAGTLGSHLSFLIVYTPGLAQSGFQTAPSTSDSDLESAFLGIHDIGGTPWLNLRVGKHAPDLPIDEHRTLTLTQGYNVYHFHPQNSTVTWEPGSNQNGIEVYGHSDLSRVRYSFSLVNENDAQFFSNTALSNPVLWGHVQAEQYLDSPLLAAVKLGAFGSVGWHANSTATLTPTGGTPSPVAFTGSNHKNHFRYGGEAHLYFLSVVNPVTLSAVVWGGQDDQAVLKDDTGAPVGVSNATFIELIHPSQGVDPALVSPVTGNVKVWTAIIRHTFELTSRTEAALHLEFSRFWFDAGDGTSPATYTGLIGLDFAL
ncbi:MAG: hypothetical protein AUH38_02830 [Deltaproteobacteria bacterium 13_1_40CM_68_24]|nr:MAG: hypothetical protein AUH38_02830 [Deltaproteobacteria bacterium 13_1_40CM_68_24]